MRQVIILERLDPARLVFRYLLWAVVPAARVGFYANPDAASAYQAATVAELDALKAGEVVERVGTIYLPPGATLAAAQAELQAVWQRFQDEITNTNKWSRHGSAWDGATWTLAGA